MNRTGHDGSGRPRDEQLVHRWLQSNRASPGWACLMCAAIAISALVATPSLATVLAKLTPEDGVNFRRSGTLLAQSIVRCTLTTELSGTDATQYFQCQVQEVLKGPLQVDDEILLQAGRDNPRSQSLALGATYYLYLEKCPDAYHEVTVALRAKVEADSVFTALAEPVLSTSAYSGAILSTIEAVSFSKRVEQTSCVVAGEVLSCNLVIRGRYLAAIELTLLRQETIKNTGNLILPDTILVSSGPSPARYTRLGFSPHVEVGSQLILPLVQVASGYQIPDPCVSIFHAVSPTSAVSLMKSFYCAGGIDTVATWSVNHSRGDGGER